MANPAYETGSCADIDDFFDKLITFVTSTSLDVANRFTEVAVTSPRTLKTDGASSGSPTYSYKIRCLSRDSFYWWMRYSATGGVYGMPASSGADATWNSITGKPTDDTQIFPIPGAGTYHFFAVDKAVHAVCQLTNGVHVHINFGTMNKIGSWTGGEFFTGCRHEPTAGWQNTPEAGQNRFMFHIGSTGNRSTQQGGKMRCVYNSKTYAIMDYDSAATHASYNTVDSVNGLAPTTLDAGGTVAADNDFAPNVYAPYNSPGVDIEYQLLRNADDSLFYDLGSIPGARFVDCSLLDPGAVVNVNWLVFPLSIKLDTGVLNQYTASKTYGIAYYKGS